MGGQLFSPLMASYGSRTAAIYFPVVRCLVQGKKDCLLLGAARDH
jgi:hypothetical protein